ncbi:site-specific integrase [Paenibacillus anseongense]|uniref:tyrosine-type recombinase/integrase n=1 Tax=Paenibacillus anseongense TaxID=2682845 RepID=UPI002DB6B1E9|nr:site-specific integrase [Paenibacillus anseongense]MEC0269699.1 site-specific integrase [Paenibacillus anseongense]
MENETKPQETLNLTEIMDEFSQQLKETAEWNQEEKDFPWNSSSTQKDSMECLDTEQSGKNVTTSKMKVVDILNGLYEVDFQYEEHSPYLGPSGITEWISTNLVSQLKIQGVLNWFHKHSNEMPYNFYQRFLLVSDFITYCANELQIEVKSVDAHVLSKPHLYTSYVATIGLNKKKITMLSSLYRRFQPFNELIIPRAIKIIAPSLCHPLVERHLQVLKKHDRTQGTINANKLACRDFLAWLCRTYRQFTVFNINDVPLHLITQPHLLEYRLYLKRKVKNKTTDDKAASNCFYYVRALFKSLHQLSLLQDDVASDIKGLPFENYHYRDIPSIEEIQRFFVVVRTYSPEPLVHLLVYSLMLYLGFRISEVTSLSWENFNQSTSRISIKGKDGKYSVMPLPEQIKFLLKQFPDEVKKGQLFNKQSPAFYQHLYNYHQLYCLLAGWTFENHGFHLFRHTYITKLSEHPQCTPKLLMKLARHVKSASTSIYIHRSSEALRQAAEKINYNLS